MENAVVIASLLAALATILTLVAAFLEYNRQGTQKRAELFFSLRERLKSDPRFREMLDLAERDDDRLREIAFADKRDLLGLFEEVEILRRSRLIRTEIAQYMFGYYAVRLYEANNFWRSVNRGSPYWVIFNEFAERARDAERDKERTVASEEGFPAGRYRF